MSNSNNLTKDITSSDLRIKNLQKKLDLLKRKSLKYRTMYDAAEGESKDLINQLVKIRKYQIMNILTKIQFPFEESDALLGAALHLMNLMNSNNPDDAEILENYRTSFKSYEEKNHLSYPKRRRKNNSGPLVKIEDDNK